MHLLIKRASPLTTIQDNGRFGMLRHGVAASGPMDRGAFHRCGAMLGTKSTAGIEFTRAGLEFSIREGCTQAAFDGGVFQLRHNGDPCRWPAVLKLQDGDRVEITPGEAGNYGYVRFSAEIDVPVVLGSRATSSIAGLFGATPGAVGRSRRPVSARASRPFSQRRVRDIQEP